MHKRLKIINLTRPMIALRTNLAVHRVINEQQAAINDSSKKLSSGYRINSASNDAAGLQISNRLNSQILGMNQAIRNSVDANSIAESAEGALSGLTDIIQRMRVLAIQSANDVNTPSDREALNSEYSQLKHEISRVAKETSFAGKNLLDGTFQESFQIGADALQTIELSIDGFDISEIGSTETTTVTTSIPDTELGTMKISNPSLDRVTFNSSSPPNRPISSAWDTRFALATATTPSSGSSNLVLIEDYNSTKEVSDAMNALGADVTATAQTYAALVFKDFPDPAYNTVPYPSPIEFNFELSGEGGSSSISASITDFQDKTQLEALVTQINTITSTTGIRATLSTGWNSGVGQYYGVNLIDDTGGNVAVNNFNVTNPESNNLEVGFGARGNSNTGMPDIGFPIGAIFKSRPLPVQNEVNGLASGFLTLTDRDGNVVSNYSETTEVPTGSHTTVTTELPATLLDDTDILTHDNAQLAIKALDGALQQVGSQRGELGAFQNRVTSIITTNQNAAVNLSASHSRIKDTDYAIETAQLVKSQIQLDATIAITSQANERLEQILPLLENML